MGIDGKRASSSERVSIVLPTMDASSRPRRSPGRLPSHYVQPNDVKALANIGADDENSSVENQQQVHAHPLLRSTNSTSHSKPTHLPCTKSEIPSRYNSNTDPPHDTGRQPTEPLKPNKCSSTSNRANAHRRSHSVPYNITNDKRSTASSPERSFSAGIIPARIDIQDSIFEGLTAQLNTYLAKYGEAHAMVAKFYNQIGNHYMRQGQHKVSLENYHNALRCFRLISSSSRSSSPLHLHLLGGAKREDDVTTTMSIAATLGNIGTVQWRMGRLEDAIETLQSAVSTAEDYSGDASQEVANLLFTLGMARSLKQEYEEAIDCFARMKHIMTNIYGPSHVEVARAVDAMGKVCILQGNPSQAIQFHSDALRVKQIALGPRHASVLQTQMNLALAFRADHKYQEALMQLSEVRSARKIALFKEADTEKRRSLAGDFGDIACLINEIQRDMNQVDENNSSMGTIDEHREC